MSARNFPTYFWTRFEAAKDKVAFVERNEAGKLEEITYWVWTRRVQKLAIGLREKGFAAGTRVAFAALNSRDWLDLAFAVWMVGGCVVPISSALDRRTTLRAMARSGCDWIVLQDRERLEVVRGTGEKLPPHLTWVTMNGLEGSWPETIFDLDEVETKGHHRLHRGGLNQLAEVTYRLAPTEPALILFPKDPGEDPHGAFFAGGKLAVMLEALGTDLGWDDDARVAVLIGYGWYYGLLVSLAALLQQKTLIIGESLRELSENPGDYRPTSIVCGPAYLEELAASWREKMAEAPDFLQGDDQSGDDAFGLMRALRTLGDRATRRLVHDPLRASLGGRMKKIYLAGTPDETIAGVIREIGLTVLPFWGRPEFGISHVTRVGAEEKKAAGRPVQGYAAKIDGARAEGEGRIMIRADCAFEGYWTETGPCEKVDGWILTPDEGKIVSGHLYLKS